MEKPRVMFMGTPQFSCGILDTLMEMGENVVAVVSQPDRKVGRKQEIQETPVKKAALAYGIPVIQPEKIKEAVEEVLAFNPDIIVTCAYGQLIPEAILNEPKYKCINVHASLLPKYRGGAPIHWAVINGDKETGITIMYMAKKMDAGEIISQQSVKIEEMDTTSSMFDKLEVVGKDLLKKTLPLIYLGEFESIPQKDEDVTFAWNIEKEQEFVSFKREVTIVYNHIRGLISWPVGYGVIDGKKIKLHRVHHIMKKHNDLPGQCIGLIDDAFVVACDCGYICIDELQLEGKSKTLAKDFFHGNGKNYVGKYFD
ncbi:methionyl-tRNA formyltransferase [Anaerorhabdus sp.]|jgi:methionyl-tRNA formyltransferase|uniref:methionyl-tRNA formyltransferase n=1 Tax=Anaerorhabdus sp. TaxID=1872524 RepID=UPI002FCCB6B0